MTADSIKEAASEARAKMKKLLEKGARHMTKITTKAVKAIIHKKWAQFKKLVRDMKKETGKFARMTLKEAKEFAAKAKRNFLRKIDQAKKAIHKGAKKVHGKMKGLYQKVTSGKKKPPPAEPEKPSWEEKLEDELVTLRAMPDGIAKQKYADKLTGDIMRETEEHATPTHKIRMLLEKVQDGRSRVVLFLFFFLSV